ncbi:MAG: D-glycerate dehydrogenase [Candidatus Magasanikbacteria bacterium]|nr:D-glycerate dehydrogenase [Candidatus Magasanikbacteria bacterium]
MPKIFVTRKIPDAGLDLLKLKNFKVVVYPKLQPISRRELLKNVQGTDAILSLLTDKIDEEVLAAAGSQLKIVSNFAVGYDNIDVSAAQKRGVFVTNTPGVLTQAVAEHTFALMMALARRIGAADRFTKSGKYRGWDPELFIGSELNGKTLGIVGLGRIGAEVARRAFFGMGMKIFYYDVKRDLNFEKEYHAQFLSIDEILKNSDFVSIHVPLLPQTHHLINKEKLKLMKPTAFLINTARGPIIDEAALAAAMRSKQIAGAALDVFEHEPKISSALKKMDNVILTPHIASATKEARDNMARLAATSIIEALEGKIPQYLVSNTK